MIKLYISRMPLCRCLCLCPLSRFYCCCTCLLCIVLYIHLLYNCVHMLWYFCVLEFSLLASRFSRPIACCSVVSRLSPLLSRDFRCHDALFIFEFGFRRALTRSTTHECPRLQTSLVKFNEFSAAAGGVYGSTLSPKEIMSQMLFTKGCLSAGVALKALNSPVMKEALLHAGVKLPSATRLANYIPVILNEEVRKHVMLS